MKRQRPSLSIATTAFQVLARTQASALGQPGLPVAIIPHSLGPRSRAELRDMVAEHLPALVALVSEDKAIKP